MRLKTTLVCVLFAGGAAAAGPSGDPQTKPAMLMYANKWDWDLHYRRFPDHPFFASYAGVRVPKMIGYHPDLNIGARVRNWVEFQVRGHSLHVQCGGGVLVVVINLTAHAYRR